MKKEVKISVKTATGEAPKSFVCVSDFGEFSNFQCAGLLGDQMALASQMVADLAKTGVKANEAGIPFYVAAVLRDLSEAVGDKNMLAGVKLLAGLEDEETMLEKAMKNNETAKEEKAEEDSIEKLFAELLAAL